MAEVRAILVEGESRVLPFPVFDFNAVAGAATIAPQATPLIVPSWGALEVLGISATQCTGPAGTLANNTNIFGNIFVPGRGPNGAWFLAGGASTNNILASTNGVPIQLWAGKAGNVAYQGGNGNFPYYLYPGEKLILNLTYPSSVTTPTARSPFYLGLWTRLAKATQSQNPSTTGPSPFLDLQDMIDQGQMIRDGVYFKANFSSTALVPGQPQVFSIILSHQYDWYFDSIVCDLAPNAELDCRTQETEVLMEVYDSRGAIPWFSGNGLPISLACGQFGGRQLLAPSYFYVPSLKSGNDLFVKFLNNGATNFTTDINFLFKGVKPAYKGG